MKVSSVGTKYLLMMTRFMVKHKLSRVVSERLLMVVQEQEIILRFDEKRRRGTKKIQRRATGRGCTRLPTYGGGTSIGH